MYETAYGMGFNICVTLLRYFVQERFFYVGVLYQDPVTYVTADVLQKVDTHMPLHEPGNPCV